MIKLPPHIENLPPYTPIEPFEVLSERVGRVPANIIKLDANENPYGMSPRARAALSALEFPHIYPDPESRTLRAALARFTGVPAAHLLAGAGADELIDLLMRVLLQPGDAILTCPPTFGMYAFDANLNAGRTIEVPRKADFSLDMDGIFAAVHRYSPKLIFIASPNNPNGLLLPQPELEKLLALPTLIILDEAYIEFSGQVSMIAKIPERENLVVLRTFSKWAGLAGLRVGYGAFPAWLMPPLWKAKQPYNINVAASETAIASLADLDYLMGTVQTLVTERQRLWDGLANVPYLTPYPTSSNFILCRVNGRDAAQLKADLAQKHGIFIRYFNKPGLTDCIRISVGKPEHTDALLKALSS